MTDSAESAESAAYDAWAKAREQQHAAAVAVADWVTLWGNSSSRQLDRLLSEYHVAKRAADAAASAHLAALAAWEEGSQS